jgi:hypothetical protein
MNRTGGILPYAESKKQPDNLLKVSWSWYNQAQGTVAWTFVNGTSAVKSFLLLRNSYYFGNAFWPVYLNNKSFNVNFILEPSPLVNNGIASNSAPVAVITFPGKGEIVAFVFTLSTGQSWSILEGGFSVESPPSGYSLIPVTFNGTSVYCITYDKKQVSDWDLQTGTTLQGYTPNPSAFETATFVCNGGYVALFRDIINAGKCP